MTNAVKEPRTEYIKVRLTKREYDALKNVCADEETTISKVIQQGVREVIGFHS